VNPFAALGLSGELVHTLENFGFNSPTPIQKKAIPEVLAGKDLLAIAETGTGKTAAYALPALERIRHHANKSASPAMHPLRMLVLLPTRELAIQVEDNIAQFVKALPLRYTVIYGGAPITPQISNLQRGIEILIATVGRLRDLLEQGMVQLNKVEIVVLDEADKMLDIGFFDEICEILSLLPQKKQTLLFSATISKEVESIATKCLNNPTKIESKPEKASNSLVKQHIIAVDSRRKRSTLVQLLEELQSPQAMIFCNTKAQVEKLISYLQHKHFKAAAIHGDKSQEHRLEALEEFKNGAIDLLIATDVAARGLNISNLPYVINYDLPTHAEDYVHRIGRTGRAGKEGIAFSFLEKVSLSAFESIQALFTEKLIIEYLGSSPLTWLKAYPCAQPSEYIKENKGKKSRNQNKNSGRIDGKKRDSTPRGQIEGIPAEESTYVRDKRRRARHLRKKEVCALLLPNYGVHKSQ